MLKSGLMVTPPRALSSPIDKHQPLNKGKRMLKMKRTRTGCVACKSRKKKCDEAVPTCGYCYRQNYICQRPQLRVYQRKGSKTSSPAAAHSELSHHTANETVSLPLPHVSTSQSDSAEDAARPDSDFADFVDHINVDGECTTPHQPQNCRSKSLTKSIEESGISPAIEILEQSSPAEPFQLPRSSSTEELVPAVQERGEFQTKKMSIRFLDPYVFFPNVAPESGVLPQRKMLNYYMSVLTPLGCLDTWPTSNFYCSAIIPMAVESSDVLTCILAWTTAHLSLLPSAPNSVKIAAIEKRSHALQAMQNVLSRMDDDDRDLAMACGLLLCAADICKGDDINSWYSHHIGLIQVLSEPFMNKLQQTAEGNWMLRTFAFHDILAATVLGTRPTIEGPYWSKPNGTHGTVIVDPLMGVSYDMFHILGEIATLSADSTPGTAHDPWDFLTTAGSLRKQINSWVVPDTRDKDLTTVSLTIMHATSLVLLGLVERRGMQMGGLDINSEAEHSVAEILRLTELTPNASCAESGLLFPLFLAGVMATSDNDALRVRTRLETMSHNMMFGHITQTIKVLEDIWQSKASRGSPSDPVIMELDEMTARPFAGKADWQQLMNSRGYKLSLA